jgi:hypothetical protein
MMCEGNEGLIFKLAGLRFLPLGSLLSMPSFRDARNEVACSNPKSMSGPHSFSK